VGIVVVVVISAIGCVVHGQGSFCGVVVLVEHGHGVCFGVVMVVNVVVVVVEVAHGQGPC